VRQRTELVSTCEHDLEKTFTPWPCEERLWELKLCPCGFEVLWRAPIQRPELTAMHGVAQVAAPMKA
jgi:hypothetical protein